MSITAADVKKLRDETDAPMMEVKRALVSADGDYDKAKQLLREAGSAAAAKRAERSTSEGIAKIVISEDGKSAAGAIVECETDFVSGNEDFKAMVNTIVNGFLAAGTATSETEIDGMTANARIEEAVGKIRENIQLRDSFFLKTEEGKFAAYNHHDGKWASYVVYTGDNAENAKLVATQVVAFKPEYLNRSEVNQELIDAEIATETARAVKEGKPQNIAENIAKGRVNKEFFQQRVLTDQLMYTDGTKVEDFAKANGVGEIKAYKLLFVGGTAGEGE